ncbi:hypothetical protein ERO13_A07G075900v2 [Gossypium hirsutum]|nr:hypothetical protein ERO13_A07G075900v2 [Gossypium hirsutum]
MESTSFSSYNLLNFNQRPLRHGPNNGPDYVGKLVDENMIVLRMRIKDTKISEGFELPSEWMEWEKQYYLHYNEDVCEAMGVLQNLLVNVRPSFGIAIVVLVLLSFPISTGVTLFHVLQLGQWFISGFNPN